MIPIFLFALTAQASHPAPRAHHSGAYDPNRGAFVVYGGFTFDRGVKRLGDIWAWDGKEWKLIGDTGLPKIVAPLAYDSKRNRLLMFGGAGDGDRDDGKLRSLKGSAWEVLKDVPFLERQDVSLIYDDWRDRLVMFGGRHASVLYSDTFEFDGEDWKPTFMAGPSLRSGAAMTFDSGRGVTVLYGGFRPLAGLGDTWEWNGKAWRQASTSGPGPRAWPGIAYDSKRKRTILFGGEDDKGHFFSDTWAWDGRKWTRLTTVGPPARIQLAMGYDAKRDRVVLFGGMNPEPRYLGDTWEFDGTRWMQR